MKRATLTSIPIVKLVTMISDLQDERDALRAALVRVVAEYPGYTDAGYIVPVAVMAQARDALAVQS